MKNVLFVCLGNICRSPLAEAVFKDIVKKRGLEDKISVDSCGTGNWHIGETPDPRSVAIASRNGIPIMHRGRQLEEADFQNFDYILAMDKANLRDITSKKGASGHDNIHLMQSFDNNQSGEDVPDPYYGGEDGFQRVFDMLQESCENLADEVSYAFA